MYDTGGSHSVCRPTTQDIHIAQRLNWLKAELDPEVQRRRLALEEGRRHALAMRRPLTSEQAYRWFGTFLGLLPPLALFDRMLTGAGGESFKWVGLFMLMNVICCLVGRRFGGYLGRRAGDPRARSRAGFAFAVLLMAVAWSVVTGGLGGVLFFGIGAIFGILCATPVALAAFPVFAILHRLISRGGMIEARHTWPLAFGIPLTIAAMIMGQ
ncbi:MAG TPA: hypothetical protein VF586_03690 [Pyrinomonadaceae bacterium]|jgi:uncharacterized membrane protein